MNLNTPVQKFRNILKEKRPEFWPFSLLEIFLLFISLSAL